MKWRYIVIGVFLLLSACILPVSATDNLGFEKNDSEYLILPLDIGDLIEPRSSISSSVTQGQARYFNHYVTPGSTEMDVVLSWTLFPNQNSLNLRITDSNGVVLADCSDTYENTIENGCIPIKLVNKNGFPSGNWQFTVTGTDVVGIQLFNIIINSY